MIFSVFRTGWMGLKRDRAALIFTFVVPIVFFSIFAAVFGAQSSKTKTPTTKVVVVDLDQTKESAQLIAALQKESALRIVRKANDKAPLFTAQTAEAYIRAGSAPVALIVPKGFGAKPIQFGGATTGPAFQILADAADPIAPQLVSGLLQKTIFTAMPTTMMTAGVDALDKLGAGLTPEQKSVLDKQIGEFDARPATSTATGGGIKVEIRDLLGQNKANPVVALQAAGIGVMFLLFTASNAGGGLLLEENESGTLDRILSTRVTYTQLLLGKWLYVWALGVVQLTVMFIWGALVFKLELMSHLAGFFIMAFATGAATSAFGLLIASLAKTRQQLSAISTLCVLSISALGGSMFPRFLMPESMQKFGLVLFNAWALDGLTNVFWRDAALQTLVLPVLVLCAWAIAFFLLARHLTRNWG
jgi:ABC-2 type transport system permease protein